MRTYPFRIILSLLISVIFASCTDSFSYHNNANGLDIKFTHRFGSRVIVTIGVDSTQTKIFMEGDFSDFSPLRISIPNDDSHDIYILDDNHRIKETEGQYYNIKIVDEYLVRDSKTIWLDSAQSLSRKNLNVVVYYKDIRFD